MADKPTVLIIGDGLSQTPELLLQLQQEKAVLHATDADQVIDVSSDNESIDLVLLDTIALGSDAHETCMWLKTDNEINHLPIIALGEKEQEASQWLKTGAMDFLVNTTPVELAVARINNLLELNQKSNLLTEIASIDPLTNLPNQQRVEEYLDIEWRRSLREFYSLSLIKIDIDDFTAYHDYYGLGQGDELMRRLARALGQHVGRAGDMLARYGSDEFMLLLPAIELDNAILLAERMVAAIADLAIPHETSKVEEFVTISAGVATIEPTRDKRYQDVLDEVEDILYRAQQAGGNQALGITL